MKKETIINLIKNREFTQLDTYLQDYSKEELNELSNDEEFFPLLFAINQGFTVDFIKNPEVLAKLELNMTNKHGTTALMELAKYDKDREVTMLLEAGADMTLKDVNGKTAKDYAIEFINGIDEEDESGILWSFEYWEKTQPE